jgi:hypothetical protein
MGKLNLILMCGIFVFQKEKVNSGPEKEKVNSGPEREKMIGSTQASPVISSAALPQNKEASRCTYRNFFMLSLIWQIVNVYCIVDAGGHTQGHVDVVISDKT